jgi:hypothetical protein
LKIPVLAGGAIYSNIQIDTLNGTAGCPIVIKPSGGVPKITVLNIGFSKTSSYFHITGNGQGVKNGMDVGTIITGIASHYQIDSVRCHGRDNGLFLHVNPNPAVPRSVYPNYVNDSVHVHDVTVDSTNGEGMYIGHTYPSGDPYSGGYVPIRMGHVEIDHCTVTNTGWDGIQLSDAGDGCSIHDNTVNNFGTWDAGAQRAGMIFGANSNGRVYNNTISNGTGNGIQIFGYGHMEVDHNTLKNVGLTHDDGHSGAWGEQTFFCKAQLNIETRPKQMLDIHDNTIQNPRPRPGNGILATNNDANYSDTCSFINNSVCFTGSVPPTWQTTYIGIAQATKIVTGNTASVCSFPVAIPGSDQVITLPSGVTFSGSGTAASGHSISSYTWTLINGSGTINSPTSATTSVSSLGLSQSIYRLTVTQEDSQTGSADVHVWANPQVLFPFKMRKIARLKNH